MYKLTIPTLNMIITGDQTAEFPATPGTKYVFSASGDFGGGTISLQWSDGTEWIDFDECIFSTDGTQVVTAPAGGLRFLVEGTTNPTISANVLPDPSGGSVDKADLGLGEVDNTSDANKPISMAQQEVLDTKVTAANAFAPGLFACWCWISSSTKLYFCVSGDGRNWNFAGSGPIFTPAGGVCRDGSVVKVGDTWILAYGNSDIGLPSFGIATTINLAGAWTEVTSVSTASVGASNYSWAPTWFQEPGSSDYSGLHVFVPISPNGVANNFQLYELHPTNAAFTSWSTPILVTGAGLPSNMIDPFVRKNGSNYEIWYKNESTKYIEVLSSTSLLTNYTVLRTGNWAGLGADIEAPCLVRLGGNALRMYVDAYNVIQSKFADSTDNGVTWSSLQNTVAPINPRHMEVHLLADIGEVGQSLEALCSGVGFVSNGIHSGNFGSQVPDGLSQLEAYGALPKLRLRGPGARVIMLDEEASGQATYITRRGVAGTDYVFLEGGTNNISIYGNLTLAAGKAVKFSGGNSASSGTGSPESVITAPIGSLYVRTDGGTGTTLYVKESGSGNTGWVAK